jgi:hypothetical protein
VLRETVAARTRGATGSFSAAGPLIPGVPPSKMSATSSRPGLCVPLVVRLASAAPGQPIDSTDAQASVLAINCPGRCHSDPSTGRPAGGVTCRGSRPSGAVGGRALDRGTSPASESGQSGQSGQSDMRRAQPRPAGVADQAPSVRLSQGAAVARPRRLPYQQITPSSRSHRRCAGRAALVTSERGQMHAVAQWCLVKCSPPLRTSVPPTGRLPYVFHVKHRRPVD